MYCNLTDGTDLATIFSFLSLNSLQVDMIQPGTAVLIKGKLTEKYCRKACNEARGCICPS
jgi:hypothetical protein